MGSGAAAGLHPGRERPDPRPRELPHAVRAAPADRAGERTAFPGAPPQVMGRGAKPLRGIDKLESSIIMELQGLYIEMTYLTDLPRVLF